MPAALNEVPTTVPISENKSIKLKAGQPWPSAYRGSRYSVVSDEDFNDAVLKWKQRDLAIFTDVPDGLRRSLVLLGKSGGYGSFRVTADNEVLTKIKAEEYKHTNQAPIDEGWILVYVGTLEGRIEFDTIELDPLPPERESIKVWEGFPFNHGERWSVQQNGSLMWKWKDYRLESAFDHPELVAAYKAYRGTAGRMYLTENAHVWVNVPKNDIASGKEGEIKRAVREWKQSAEQQDRNATLRLVNRRLVATSGNDDPSTGHFPVHLGHLSHFDGGVIPRPIVDDPSYFKAAGQYEQVWE